jgi:hypothetical protein
MEKQNAKKKSAKVNAKYDAIEEKIKAQSGPTPDELVF